MTHEDALADFIVQHDNSQGDLVFCERQIAVSLAESESAANHLADSIAQEDITHDWCVGEVGAG